MPSGTLSPAARMSLAKHGPFMTRLKVLRLRLGLSIREAADGSHIGVSHYYRIEAGLIRPGLEVEARIKTFYGITSAQRLRATHLTPANRRDRFLHS